MFSETYSVHIQNIFEGPMDLLVYLIRKNDLDIYDIPIATITDRYREYLDMMQIMNIDIAAEFLVMAATLTQIKSRMLLPVHEDETDSDDPRLEITRPLIEYMAMKSIAHQLKTRPILGEHMFSTDAARMDGWYSEAEKLIEADLFDLVQAFQKMLDRLLPPRQVHLCAERISIRDRMMELMARFDAHMLIDLDDLFFQYDTKPDMIITFLAVLELTKQAIIRIYQHAETGLIRLIRL